MPFLQLANRQKYLTEERLRVSHYSDCAHILLKKSNSEASSILNNTHIFLDDMAQVCQRWKQANRADATPTP